MNIVYDRIIKQTIYFSFKKNDLKFKNKKQNYYKNRKKNWFIEKTQIHFKYKPNFFKTNFKLFQQSLINVKK